MSKHWRSMQLVGLDDAELLDEALRDDGVAVVLETLTAPTGALAGGNAVPLFHAKHILKRWVETRRRPTTRCCVRSGGSD